MEIPPDSAAKIFREDFYGSGTSKLALSGGQVELAHPTSLTPEELLLEKARARGEFPIYRIDKTLEGKPLTMFQMVQTLQDRFEEQNWGRLLYAKAGGRWYQDEAFFMEDTPKPGLALVSKAPISGSLDRNYHRQTNRLSELVSEIYEGREMPTPYQDALKEWVEDKGKLEGILTSDWKGAAKGLAELQINQLLREKPVEVFQSIIVPFVVSQGKERRLEHLYTLTNAVTFHGCLVDLGYFAPDGLDVHAWYPDDHSSYIGVCSSRSFL